MAGSSSSGRIRDGSDRGKKPPEKKGGGLFDAIKEGFAGNKDVKRAAEALAQTEKLFKGTAESVGQRERSETHKVDQWLDQNPYGATLAQSQKGEILALMTSQGNSMQESFNAFCVERNGVSRNYVISANDVSRANEIARRYTRDISGKSASMTIAWDNLKSTLKEEREQFSAAPAYEAGEYEAAPTQGYAHGWNREDQELAEGWYPEQDESAPQYWE